MAKSLNVFNYSSYRVFLREWVSLAKEEKRGNLNQLAVVAQVHATFLSHILAGTKELSLEQAALLCEHFEFTSLEQDYFLTLLQLERAGNQALKKYWHGKKKEIEAEKNKLGRRFEKHQELSEEQKAIFYSSWMYAAVWVATAVDEGQSSGKLAEVLHLPRQKIEEILFFLAQNGLCTESDGIYKIGEVHLHVSNDSPLIAKHHTNWRMKAVQKMDMRGETELFFTSPMSVSKSDFVKIREILNGTIKEIITIAKESDAEDIVCLNMDYFILD